MQKDTNTEKTNPQRVPFKTLFWALDTGILEQDEGIVLNTENIPKDWED